MRFTIISAFAAFATLATAANTVQFVNQDSTERTVYFTPNDGLDKIDTAVIKGNSNHTATFPDGWIGNWYSVSEGSDDVPGMLGEVRFGGFAGATYFDVSAIVNPDDSNGVKLIYPKESKTPVSGCETFPCSNAYNLPDDIATLSTDETELICIIGNADSSSIEKVRRHPRDFVLGSA